MEEIVNSSPENEKEKIMEQSEEHCSKWPELSRNITSVFMGEIIGTSLENEKEITEQSEEHFSKWAELPSSITHLISDRLGFPDILRFSSICMPWRSVLKEARRLHQRSYIPMVLFEYNLSKGTFGFFSFEENKVYWINLEEAPDAQCVGSSESWLVMSSRHFPRCFIVNPFTGTRIDLPCFNNLKINIYKVILLSNPFDLTSNKPNFDCPIVALSSTETDLNICKIGDERWTSIKLDCADNNLASIIFHKGEIYALSRTGELWITNLAGPMPCVCRREVVYPQDISDSLHDYQIECCLVGSKENLLLVLRLSTRSVRRTVKFMIYMLVETAGEYELERVPFLADDQVLFVGRLCSKSISIGECKGLQGNSIYFTDDKLLKFKKNEYPEKGIYSLKTGNIIPYNLSFDLYPFDQPHIWITPSI